MAEPTPGVNSESISPIENTYQGLLGDHVTKREAFVERLEPQPESEQFKSEMADPRMMKDIATDLDYGVYQLNRDKQGLPVVVNLAWSLGADTPAGRGDLNAFVTHLDRPVIVIDMEAVGLSDRPNRSQRRQMDFAELAKSRLRLLDQLDVDRFDVVGFSMGGVMAAKMAAEAGDRVSELITISAPGFDEQFFPTFAKHFAFDEGLREAGKYVREARPSIQEAVKTQTGPLLSSETVRGLPMLLKQAAEMSKPVLANLTTELSTQTHWVDMVGSKDHITDWADHVDVVRQRNVERPHSSQSYILGSETHSWGIHRSSIAEAAAITLDRSDHRHNLMDRGQPTSG